MTQLIPFPAADITSDRNETKYVVPLERVGAIVTELDKLRLRAQRAEPAATEFSLGDYFVTTVYFDTASRSHFRRASENFGRTTKVRARTYFNVCNGGVTLPGNALWLEMKRREGNRTLKQRALLPRHELLDVVAGQRRAEIQGTATPDAVEAIAEYCRSLSEPLGVSSVVNYRRLSFQSDDAKLRITLDLSLAYFAPAPDLLTSRKPLLAGALGKPRGFSGHSVLELKHTGPLPAWCSAFVERHALRPSRFCKFLAAERAVTETPLTEDSHSAFR